MVMFFHLRWAAENQAELYVTFNQQLPGRWFTVWQKKTAV